MALNWQVALRTQLRTHVLRTVVLGGVTVGILWWGLSPPSRVTPPAVAKVQPLPSAGVQRAPMAEGFLTLQNDLRELKGSVAEEKQTNRALREELRTAAQDRKVADEAHKQELLQLTRQMQETERKMAAAAATKPAPALPAPRPQPAPLVTLAKPAVEDLKITILRSKEGASFPTKTARPARTDAPYLPAGSLAGARLITGAMASTREAGAIPVLLALTTPFVPPWQLQGPGANPLPTAMPIQGCFVLGRAVGDLANSRTIIKGELLSCVLPDGTAFEAPLKAYVIGLDHSYGLVCEVTKHESAAILKAFLTGLLQEASAAFGVARSKLVVTSGSGPQPFSGAQTSLQKISDFYLQQAQFLLPTCWVQANTPARLVVEEGVPLEGVPTQHVYFARRLGMP